MIFLTSYSVDGALYGTHLEAEDWADARAVARQRNIGERIEGKVCSPMYYFVLAELIEKQNWVDAAHEATFLCFLGLSSGTLGIRETMGDTGLVHSLLHLAQASPYGPDEDKSIVEAYERDREALIERVKRMAMDFERRVPGHTPSFGRPVLGTPVGEADGATPPETD